MKKALSSILALVMCLSLCACGSANGPSKKIVEQDLIEALHLENEHVTLTDYETVKSLTEESTYQITLSVSAHSKYAQWSYEVDMYYTQYDQGWKIDKADFVTSDYTVTSAPDVDSFTEYATNYLKNHEVYAESSYQNEMFPMNDTTLTSVDSTQIQFEWTGTETLKHAFRYHYFTSLWQYDAKNDNWTLVPNDEDYYGYHLDSPKGEIIPNYSFNFSGTYYIDGTDDITITISNFSWDGFDLSTSHETWEVNGHFVLTKDYHGISTIFYTSSTGALVAFEFLDSYTRLSINDGHNIFGNAKIHWVPMLN